MCEQFYNALLTNLSEVVTDEQLDSVSRILSSVMNNYEIKVKSTEIVVFNPIPDCLKTYLVSLSIEGKSKGTISLYENRLYLFFDAVRKKVDEITPNDIRRFMYEYQSSRSISNHTMETYRVIISAFFSWALVEGYVTHNPSLPIKSIKYEKKERIFLSETEMELVRSACKTVKEKAIIETFYSTGCRLSELLSIKRNDVNWQDKSIKIIGKGNKQRTIYVSPKAELLIKEYLTTRDDNCPYLFATDRHPIRQLTPSTIQKSLKDIGENANLNRKLYPHLIRHTTATYGIRRGMNVVTMKNMLGHESINTTLIYAKISENDVRIEHDKYIV